MQLFTILKFISWSQFCEWLDLKNNTWPSRWYELEAVRNNLILEESWLTFGPQLLMRLQELRYCYTIKFSQKGTISTVEAIRWPYFSKIIGYFSIHIDLFQIWSISTWPWTWAEVQTKGHPMGIYSILQRHRKYIPYGRYRPWSSYSLIRITALFTGDATRSCRV